MTSRRQKTVGKVISLFLALSLAPCYAFGNLNGSDPDAKPTAVIPAPKRQSAARLAVRGNLPVLVNGNGSFTGATILSGATIQTPGSVRATIQLGGLGSIDLTPNTVARIDFDNDTIKGTLRRGCATLSANKEVSGTLMTPDGTSVTTEKGAPSTVNVCSADASAPIPTGAGTGTGTGSVPAPTAATKSGLFGLSPNSMLALLGAGGMVTGAVRGNNAVSGTTAATGSSTSGAGAVSSTGSGGITSTGAASGTGVSGCCCCCCCCCCNPSPSRPCGC
jgi:hypothetical protein